MLSWPVVVTNACADLCAREFGLAGREQARAWLYELLGTRGRVTAEPPAALRGRRSPSGYFCVIDGMLALPLATDREGRGQWIATSCVVFPDYRHRYGTARSVDPFSLAGPVLLGHVNFTHHAVQRFQERCGGHPDPVIAGRQLADALGPDVRASRRPPGWCRTQPADFFLVAGEELCLPMSLHGSGGKSFDAKTCIHRASDLFQLRGVELAARCRPVRDDLEDRGAPFQLDQVVTSASHLSWVRPSWASAQAGARFWLILSDRAAAPVAWVPEDTTPLVVLGVVRRSGWFERLLVAFRPRRG